MAGGAAHLHELEEALLRFSPDATELPDREDAGGADVPPAAGGGRQAMFRDAGDIGRDDIPEPIGEALNGTVNGTAEELNDEYAEVADEIAATENEVPDGLEWLWRRSTDS